MYGSPKESGVDAGRLIVEISEDECQQLLASKSVGRLAVSTDVGPEIFPVNYGVLDGSIVLWAAAGPNWIMRHLTASHSKWTTWMPRAERDGWSRRKVDLRT